MPSLSKTHANAWPEVRFATPTGTVELAVGEGLDAPLSRPARVTTLLAAFLESVDGEPATAAVLRSLSAGSREWLLQQAAATCRPSPDWFDCTCPACTAEFDISLDLAAMPRAQVPAGFPHTTLTVAGRKVVAQVPNGAVEEALAASGATGTGAMRLMLRHCIADRSAQKHIDTLPDDDIRRLDAALDAATPDCADMVTTHCPDCGTEIAARIDPLDHTFPGPESVLRDVHLLGRTYHWAEAEILALPTVRRKRYVAMVTRAAGADEKGRPWV